MPSSVVRPRPEILKDLRKQIAKGRDIAESRYDEMEDALDDETKWDLYNLELLSQSFSGNQLVNEYRSIPLSDYDEESDEDEVADTHTDRMLARVTFLESVVERLHLMPDAGYPGSRGPISAPILARSTHPPKVFIIHGHDGGAKSEVARLVERLGLTAVILHEQPNQGKTILEKLERHSDAAFAIALLTPDDVGGSSATSQLRPRARQNVIFELGIFQSKLGRDKVCILYTPGVEMPSDYGGFVYCEMDKSGGWQLKVAKELKAAGIPVDLNLIA